MRLLAYKAHVCRQQYVSVDNLRERLDACEKKLPEYEDSLMCVSRPSYFIRQDSDGSSSAMGCPERGMNVSATGCLERGLT